MGFGYSGNPNSYKTENIYAFGTPNATLFQDEYRKSLSSEEGQAFLEAQKQRAFNIARQRVSSGSANVASDVRNQLIDQRTQALVSTGKFASEKDARSSAAMQVAEELRAIGLESEKAYEPLKEINIAMTSIASRLQQSGPSIVKFLSDFSDKTTQLNANLGASISRRVLGDQATSGIFGQTSFVNTNGLAESFTNKLNADVVSSYSTKNAGDLTKLGLGGFLSPQDTAVFSDIAQVKRGLGGINSSIVSGLGGKAFQESDQVEQAIGKLLPGLFKAQGINVQTGEGKDLLAKVQEELYKATETEGGRKAFEQDRAGFVSSILNKFGANLDVAGERVKTAFAKLQEEIDKSNSSFEKFRSIQQRLVDQQQSVFNTQFGRVRETSTIGASSSSIRSGISAMIANTGAGVFNGQNLNAAGANLIYRQNALAGFQNALQNNPNDPNLIKQANTAQQDLILAQDEYNRIINDTNNAMTLLRARIEETNKQFAILLETAGVAGGKTESEFSRDRFKLGQAGNLFGGVASRLSSAGITTAEQFGALSQEEQRKLIGPLTGSQSTLDAINTLGQYGGVKLKGSNVQGSELAKIAQQYIGRNRLGGIPGLENIAGETTGLGQSRQADFQTLSQLQDQQLAIQDNINKSVLGIYAYLVNKSGTAEDKARLTSLQQFSSTLPVSGSVPAQTSGGQQGANGTSQLNSSMQALAASLQNLTNGKIQITYNGEVKVNGLQNAGKDAAVTQVVISILEQFAKQLDRSNPSEASLADKLNAAIKTIQNGK